MNLDKLASEYKPKLGYTHQDSFRKGLEVMEAKVKELEKRKYMCDMCDEFQEENRRLMILVKEIMGEK